jgi:hypothetical protein
VPIRLTGSDTVNRVAGCRRFPFAMLVLSGPPGS